MTATFTPTPAEPRHRTKQQFVYRRLRDQIIRCELKPGERLVIDELARRFEVSIIPVRESLRLLQSEGLVENVAHVGMSVAPLSRESILEVFTILEGLESAAARIAVERATDDDLAALEALLHEMDEALRSGEPEEWSELNTRFHLALSALAAMPLLQQMMERVLDLWNRVRRWYVQGVLVHRAQQAQDEHHELVAQIKRRDPAALEETIRKHNQGAAAAYTGYLERTPKTR